MSSTRHLDSAAAPAPEALAPTPQLPLELDPHGADRPEQLTLLLESPVPLQFRLDERTRRRGLAHIAAIRRQLAERSATKDEAVGRPVPRRQDAA